MNDLAESVINAMSPVEPIGLYVVIHSGDGPIMEAKGVPFNGSVAFMVRSAPSAIRGETIASKDAWESKLCCSPEAFKFWLAFENIRLGFVMCDSYVQTPDPDGTTGYRVHCNPYGLWDVTDETNNKAMDVMIAAMSGVLKVPENGLFHW